MDNCATAVVMEGSRSAHTKVTTSLKPAAEMQPLLICESAENEEWNVASTPENGTNRSVYTMDEKPSK